MDRLDRIEESIDFLLQMQGSIVLTLARIYDTLALTLYVTHPIEAEALIAMHKNGETATPLPFLTEEDIDENKD